MVIMAHECIKDVSQNNGVDFDTNLEYFLENLREDIYDIESGDPSKDLHI